MKFRLVALGTILFLSSGCASWAVPRFQNMRSYAPSTCDPVLTVHIPKSTADLAEQGRIIKTLAETINKNPTLLDRIFPSPETINAMGRNGIAIGTGVAAIASAIQGNISLGSVISSAALGAVTALTDIRSEDETQDRVEVCLPTEAKVMYFVSEDHKLFIDKRETSQSDLSMLKEIKLDQR